MSDEFREAFRFIDLNLFPFITDPDYFNVTT
jgi:hypothetical protein